MSVGLDSATMQAIYDQQANADQAKSGEGGAANKRKLKELQDKGPTRSSGVAQGGGGNQGSILGGGTLPNMSGGIGQVQKTLLGL